LLTRIRAMLEEMPHVPFPPGAAIGADAAVVTETGAPNDAEAVPQSRPPTEATTP
jgi:hypothetical protein